MRSPTKNVIHGWRYGLRLGMAVTVAACGLLPLPPAPAAAAPPPVRPARFPTIAYVANSCPGIFDDGAVTRLDPATNTVAGYTPAGGCPAAIALDPDGDRAYVANLARDGEDAILVMSTISNDVLDEIEVDHGPQGVAVTPDGAQVYATIEDNFDFSHKSNKVLVIDARTDSISDAIPIAGDPGPVAVDHEGRRALVGVSPGADGTFPNLTVINTRTNAISRIIPLPASPRAIAVHPLRHRAYVTGNYWERGQVSVIDTATGGLLKSIPVSGAPLGVAVSDDGTRAYVATVADRGESALTVIDTVTNAVTATIAIPGYRRPIGVALSHDGKTAYLTATTGKEDAVVVIDTARRSVTATIDVGDGLNEANTQNIAVGRLIKLRTHLPPRKPRPGKPGKPGRAGESGEAGTGPAMAVDVLGPPPGPARLVRGRSTGSGG
ncbi:YncE family protein [Nonomuraea sp. NPDC050691]|uniref:YncE family protein n=1 Tax=Nonomuraea sp. NPDC050691 TaxID=3155661 RepID=UPI0033C617E0